MPEWNSEWNSEEAFAPTRREEQARKRAEREEAAELRTRLNIELNFPPKFRGARSRLYRRRFLQVNTRWKALAEIYTMALLCTVLQSQFFRQKSPKLFRD